MSRRLRLLFVWVLFVPCCWGASRFSEMRVETIYQDLCATCHGVTFEGGLGGSLVDGEWVHGGADEEVARSIAEGQPELGMMPWKDTLSKEQVRAMVIYLREQEARMKKARMPRPSLGEVVTTEHVAYRAEVVVRGLKIPWAIAFLPDGRKLVTERVGRLRMISAEGVLHKKPILHIPEVAAYGQGGLMEVALHPDYEENGWIYLGLSEGREGARTKKPFLTSVFRGRIRDHRWVDEEVIYRADERFYTGSGVHFGTRFVFDKGYLFFVVGERGGWNEAQDLSRPNGKIFRLHDDGRVPVDNPFVDVKGALAGIWSFGHRNPQGLDVNPATGGLCASEHGPRGGDELNVIVKGGNYGWPFVTHGMHYNGRPITAETVREGMEGALLHWTPSIAPCGFEFYRGDGFPEWRGDLFVGSLKFKELRRLRLGDGVVVEQEVVLKGLGRVRDVAGGRDGALYVVLNSPGRVIRLVPVLAR